MINRRSLITGLISFVAAPAIVKASSLMPVKVDICMTRISNYLLTDEVKIDVLYGSLNSLKLYGLSLGDWVTLND